MTNNLKYFFPVLLMMLFIQVKGQKNELGASLGVMNYRGELAPGFNPLFSRPAGSVFYRRNFSPVIALRTALTIGDLYASDTYSSTPVADLRKATFHGFITEASVMLEYNFFNYILSYLERKNVTKYSPYLTGGIALFNAQTTSNLQSQESEASTKIAIPMGIGLKYMLTDQWNLGIEAIARKTFTDRLDGVSTNVINNRMVGDPVTKDMYYYFSVAISYTFYKVHCPRR